MPQKNENMTLKNFTPHAIKLNDSREFACEGLTRVSATFNRFDEYGVCEQNFGEVTGLPNPADDTLYIVSALVLTAAKAAGRADCVAPATGHPDCVRNEKGFIISVPGFVR